jgi:hypothetical protein
MLFPNPANKYIQIFNLAEGSTYQIIDVQGREIQSQVYNGKSIDVKDLEKGIYLFRSNAQSQKFIIE